MAVKGLIRQYDRETRDVFPTVAVKGCYFRFSCHYKEHTSETAFLCHRSIS